ncbi:MAG: hypothetical protein K2W85_12400 [Phycisphaerales bacterium]|nr:hypothetical protein [Phycisphaerales bacterium]
MRLNSLAAGIALLAGTSLSLAQAPVVDGTKDASYGAAKWLQTVPTSFGDNRADLCQSIGNGVRIAINNSNAAGVDGSNGGPSSGAGVTTGVEIAIPLLQLGNPTGPIRVTAFNSGGGYDYLSNQVVGGLPAGTGNLGGNGTGGFVGGASPLAGINFNNFAGDQFVSVVNNAATNIGSITVDGTADAAYGAALWEQTLGTGFGNSTLGQVGFANGSEIDGFFAQIATVSVDGQPAAPHLIMTIAGNLNSDFNKISIFIDTGAAGGQNVLANNNPGAEGLNNHQGLTFDSTFAANYYMSFRVGGAEPVCFADFAKLHVGITGAGGGGGFLGGGVTPPAAIIGTGSACPPNQAVAVGSELNALYSFVDRANNRLHLFVAGNFKADDFLTLIFDSNGNPSGDVGQNTLRGPSFDFGPGTPNVDIGIADGGRGGLNRLGSFDGSNPGLTFDAGFAADYYSHVHVENVNRLVIDSAVIRTNGRLEETNGNGLDFGSFHGADIPAVLPFDGTNFCCTQPGGIEWQSGSKDNVFTALPPREANRVLQGYLDSNAGAFPATEAAWADWIGVTPNQGNPVAPLALRPRYGLHRAALNNSNVAGVTDLAVGTPAAVTTGFELSYDLGEIGATPRSRIKLAGFLIRGGFTQVSNQIFGDAAGTANLGEPRTLNLSTIAGQQWVRIATCAADYDQSGSVEVGDIFAYLNDWFAGVATTDIDGGGIAVTDIFAFLNAWFEGDCQG